MTIVKVKVKIFTMNKFERQRQRVEHEYENELEQLNRLRDNIESSEYWSKYGELASKYKEMLDDIDSQQRAHAALSAAKESPKQIQRPEASYMDIVGQLKATKLSELISELASIPTQDIEEVDINDPFYLDKKEPLNVFERWWLDELEELPSVAEIREFLSRIHINRKGYITYDIESDSSIDDKPEDILKVNCIKSSKDLRKERKAAQIRRVKTRMPLLAGKDPNKYIKAVKASNRTKDNAERATALISVVDSYDLPVELSDLLYTHIENVCIPKGMLRVEQYQPMLEQFLRFVPDNKDRVKVVKESIHRNWRVLSNGTY